MVQSATPDSDELLQLVSAGDPAAEQNLLMRYRSRLKRMVSVRLDRRLASRVDPSGIVQETLAEVAQKLPEYLRERPLPFYPWVRQLALEHILREHRRHLKARNRSLEREEQYATKLPDHSAIELAKQLVANGTSPSEQVGREELRLQVRQVLNTLNADDREVLVLRYLEHLTTEEAAAVLGVTVAALRSRQRRALERFSRLFQEGEGDRP